MSLPETPVAYTDRPPGQRRAAHRKARKTTLPARAPGRTCNAASRSGGYCTQRSGWGTDHPGQGRCKLHGGASPVRSGLYSMIKRPQIKELAAEFEAHPDHVALSLLPELAQMRALYVDCVERYDELREALLAWHQSFGLGLTEKFAAVTQARQTGNIEGLRRALDDVADTIESARDAKPRQVLDLAAATDILDKIGRMVARIEAVRAVNAIGRRDFMRLMQSMALAVDSTLTEAALTNEKRTEIIQGIIKRWHEIRLNP